MKVKYTAQDLIDFETEIGECFNNKEIKSPIHLSCNNELQLIEIFSNNISEDDFIYCSWRSHYHHLLKGVPKETLKKDIINGRSISLCYPEYKTFSSAIVGGIIPISLGTAFSIKKNNKNNKVWCFVGDMSSCTGTFQECLLYAKNFNLPITYIIENNGKSVCTNTYKVWNTTKLTNEPEYEINKVIKVSFHLWYYWYNLDKWPHAGSGIRVQF